MIANMTAAEEEEFVTTTIVNKAIDILGDQIVHSKKIVEGIRNKKSAETMQQQNRLIQKQNDIQYMCEEKIKKEFCQKEGENR